MSDTPETDAFFFRIDIDWDMEVEFARRLERERDEAIKLLKYSSTYSTTKAQEDTYKFLRKINKWKEVKLQTNKSILLLRKRVGGKFTQGTGLS
jgi:hypothetical protein